MSGDNKKGNGDESTNTNSLNCNRRCTTLNVELGKLFREFRQLWFQKSGDDWGRCRQFSFTFLGSLTYFISFSSFAISTGVLSLKIPAATLAPTVVLYSLALLIVISSFYAWILAWTPKKSGPVRLYLAGIALPAFVTSLILLPFRLSGLMGGP